nr:SDR family NAD(P)-dependent oxidoreductase [Heyndrickxia coagulans]
MAKQRVAVITGSGQGIGKGIAEKLANDGFALVLSEKNQEVLDATEKEFKEKGFTVASFAGDVSNPEDQKALVQSAVENFGSVDVFVNKSLLNESNLACI